MDISPNKILVFSLLTTLLTSFLFFLSYRRQKKKEHFLILELWLSMSLYVTSIIVFSSWTNVWIDLSVVGWIWPLITFNRFLFSISGLQTLYRNHFFLISLGAFATFAFIGYGREVGFALIPFSVTVGGVGLYTLFLSMKFSPKTLRSPNLMGPSIS